MKRMIRPMACLAALFCLASAVAEAQQAPPPVPNRRNRGNGMTMAPAMPDPGGTRVAMGTRLEPGAVLCRTPEGLSARQAAIAAQSAGDDANEPLLPNGCVLVAARTPVEVLERRGYGRTLVKTVTRLEETGWTDAYLPQR